MSQQQSSPDVLRDHDKFASTGLSEYEFTPTPTTTDTTATTNDGNGQRIEENDDEE